jgi:DNA modification methylase
MKQFKLMLGDNIVSLKKLPDNSIDSIVSDPPYGLSFMGKKWDYDVPSVEFWKEVYRVLKPGGHVLSFGGTRTYHRMVVNIEDAGFEIRDQIMWLYGSGFPKSHNIGKAVDKIEGNDREVVGGIKQPRMSNDYGKGNHNEREVKELDITKGNSPWEGWGTALKPANEPICVARKPLSEKSVAENVLKWGTGGINVDGCRVGSEVRTTPVGSDDNRDDETLFGLNKTTHHERVETTEGRFPANIILDEIAGEMLDEQSGVLKSGEVKPNHKKNKTANGYQGSCYGKFKNEDTSLSGYGDKGGASRFFYQAKVSKQERNMGLDGFEVIINIGTIKLLIYKRKNNIVWEKQDLNQTHQVDMEQSHQKDIEEYTTKEECVWNTELFGNYIMEKFQKDYKSIIETKTNSITIYQTLNSLIQQNTNEYIATQQKELMGGIKYVESADKKNTKAIITYQRKDGLNPNVNPVLLEEVWSISVEEEIKSIHPTMKPVALMTYLCRLVTPPNGIVLDPFMGSGSTGISACLEGFRFVGMEMDEDYFKIASARIEEFEKYRKFIK